MDIRADIKVRDVPPSIAIVRESIKAVREKWNDGVVRETDNLQIVLRNTGPKALTNVFVYLRYLDKGGDELGHEFDLTIDPLEPGAEGRVSLMLVPPEHFHACALSVTADEVEGRKSRLREVLAEIGVAAVIFLVLYLVTRS